MELRNRLRIFVASLLITLVYYPWRGSEKTFRRRFPIIEHYLIMRIFRSLSHHYPVTIRYSNPVSKETQVITLRLDLCENNHLWYFRSKAGYELEWVKLISLGMDNAESFIDVGANLGVFAVTIAQAFSNRRIVAIEPLPYNYLKLEESIRLNGLSNIEAVRAAVTETTGPVSFYINPIHDGGGSVIEPQEYRTGDVRIDTARYQATHPDFNPTVEVQGLRLDDIITSKSVLKIDVEGAEVSVLKSGMRSLKSGAVELMVVEVTNNSINEVIGLLNSAEFDCFIYGQRLPITDGSQFNRRLGNILGLRRGSHLYDSIRDSVAMGKV